MSDYFIYPREREYPFDAVCGQIVRALQERNWSVPGISVEFDRELPAVRYVRGDDFKLWFCRGDRGLTGVAEIIIPGKQLRVYSDHAGPTLYVYVGRSWKRDRQAFMNHSKVNSKLRREPRTYLKYSGSCNCQSVRGASFDASGLIGGGLQTRSQSLGFVPHTHPGRRMPILLHDNDLGREYDPKGKEPVSYRADDVFEEFRKWLQEKLLPRIRKQPATQQA
jgi:hypothetical protein